MIREGDTVVVRLHDDASSHMLMVKGTQKLFKRKVDVEGLIGAPYGAVFEVGEKSLTRVRDDAGLELDDVMGEDDAKRNDKDNATTSAVVKGDNSNYNDTNTAQKMSFDEIHKLRADGASGLSLIHI